jgi:hypothetical protein
MPISAEGIFGHRLTREEFDVLGFIDSRHFVHSATGRFAEWKSSFDSSHPDWRQRAEVQDVLARLCVEVVRRKRPEDGRRLRMLFTGASLGSVATYFLAARLREVGLLDLIDIEICDLLEQPLVRTKGGDFEFTEKTAELAGLGHLLSPKAYKALLSDARTWQSNAVDLSIAKDESYDIVVAPYLHHHLNFADKTLACAELSRVTKRAGLCVVGDLTFDYQKFCVWLQKHSSEDVPYALECFVTRQMHEAMFPGCRSVAAYDGDFYYATVLRKHG